MTRKLTLSLLLLAAPALSGCAVQAALLAAELAPEIRGPMGPSNAHLRQTAIDTCTTRAAQHGSVYIVDVEQRRADRIIIWGSVTDARQHRRTFECHVTTRLVSFKLRQIGES